MREVKHGRTKLGAILSRKFGSGKRNLITRTREGEEGKIAQSKFGSGHKEGGRGSEKAISDRIIIGDAKKRTLS